STTGEKLSPIGKNLKRISAIDKRGIHPGLAKANFTVFCDVNNPLHGTHGSAFVFARQKGASKEMVKELDKGLQHYAKILKKAFEKEVNFPGAGAAGGLPASIHALAHATIRSGTDFIIEFTGLDK